MKGNSGVDGYPERFALDCEEGKLLDGAERILVACSGGPDSIALALLLAAYPGPPGGSRPEILIGHLNHSIRGEDADLDESFVREFAAELGCRFINARLSPATGEEPGGLLSEGRARQLRYGVFADWARELRLDCIATGHHRDDQHETILLRLCRGTGIAGLAGIPPVRTLENTGGRTRLVRPLLGWSRAELLDYLASCEQGFRTDQTNTSLDIPRNRVRHEVLPLLEEHVHPGVRSSLSHLAGQAADLQEDLESLAGGALHAARLADERAGRISLTCVELSAWPPGVRREVYAAVARELGPAEGFFTRRQFDSIEGVLGSLQGRAGADLGGGLRVERAGEHIEFSLAPLDEPQAPPVEDVLLQVDGEPVTWGGWSLSARREAWGGPCSDPFEEWVDEYSIGDGLLVRGRLPGDRVWPLGAPGSKKLKEFLRESGVSSPGRDGIPLVVSGEKIVWVVGQRLCQPFSISSAESRAVRLQAQRIEETA